MFASQFSSDLEFVDVCEVKYDSQLASVQNLVMGNLTMVAGLMDDLHKKQVDKETVNA